MSYRFTVILKKTYMLSKMHRVPDCSSGSLHTLENLFLMHHYSAAMGRVDLSNFPKQMFTWKILPSKKALTGKPIGSPDGWMGSETITTLGVNSPLVFLYWASQTTAFLQWELLKVKKTLKNYLSNFTFIWKKIIFSDLLKYLKLKQHFGEKKKVGGQSQASALLNHRKNKRFNNTWLFLVSFPLLHVDVVPALDK